MYLLDRDDNAAHTVTCSQVALIVGDLRRCVMHPLRKDEPVFDHRYPSSKKLLALHTSRLVIILLG